MKLYIEELVKDKFLSRLKDLTPIKSKKLSTKQLLDYHRKCHMLHAANIKRKPLNKELINEIMSIHDILVKEMKRRGFSHTSPLKNPR